MPLAAGDVVLLFTRYVPRLLRQPGTLTPETVEFLATLPVRAYGTDAFGVETLTNTKDAQESGGLAHRRLADPLKNFIRGHTNYDTASGIILTFTSKPVRPKVCELDWNTSTWNRGTGLMCHNLMRRTGLK